MAAIGRALIRSGRSIPSVLSLWNRNMCEFSSPVKCKNGIVTGGAVGIGFAFADMLLRCGANCVLIGDILEKEGEEAAKCLCEKYGEEKAMFLKTDVTKKEEMEGLFKCAMEKHKKIDIVINNAGILKDKTWEREIDVNVTSLVRGTLMGFDYMGKHKDGCGGCIVNISSIYGLQQAHGCPIYNGTKAFSVFFSDAFSHEYYMTLTGVKVITICPGVTETAMITESGKFALDGFGDLGKVLKEELASLPNQPAESCARCLIKILCTNECGGIYVIEDSECYQIKLPDRQTFRISQ